MCTNLIIFGCSNGRKTVDRNQYNIYCTNCNRKTYANIIEDSRWFSICFIGLIKYNRYEYIACENCEIGFTKRTYCDTCKLYHSIAAKYCPICSSMLRPV